MAKKEKAVSFDVMMKGFLQKYNISTKKDIEKLMTRLDNIEKLVKKVTRISTRAGRAVEGGRAVRARSGAGSSAADIALGVVKDSKKGADFSEIQAKTGFPDKKLRNIIFRLNRLGKIKRKSRGIYIAS